MAFASTESIRGDRTRAGRARRRARMEPPDARARPQAVGFWTVVRAVVGGVRLTLALLRDERVATHDKLAAGAALVYLVSPVDLILDVIPVIGQLDDLALIVWAWRRLVQSAGLDVIEDHWHGDDQALRLVLTFAGAES